jgi:hypothetical protein
MALAWRRGLVPDGDAPAKKALRLWWVASGEGGGGQRAARRRCLPVLLRSSLFHRQQRAPDLFVRGLLYGIFLFLFLAVFLETEHSTGFLILLFLPRTMLFLTNFWPLLVSPFGCAFGDKVLYLDLVVI